MPPESKTSSERDGLAENQEKIQDEAELQRLLDRFHAGDRSVLPILWRDWGPRIVRAARRRFLPRGGDYTTSDLGQSIICALLMQAERSDEFGTCPPAFRAYVAAAAMNRARRRGRERARKPEADKLWRGEWEPDPASRLLEEESAERARSRMALLKDPRPVRLSAEGVPVRVQAELLGTTVPAVKNRSLRDRRRLREALEDET